MLGHDCLWRCSLMGIFYPDVFILMNTVFVYGTLKRGGRNNGLLKSAEYLGTGHTIDSMSMGGTECVPFVTSYPESYPIFGELYQVDDPTLRSLDRLEGHPDFYRRIPVSVRGVAPEQLTMAWIYVVEKIRNTRPFPHGDWPQAAFDAAQNRHVG